MAQDTTQRSERADQLDEIQDAIVLDWVGRLSHGAAGPGLLQRLRRPWRT